MSEFILTGRSGMTLKMVAALSVRTGLSVDVCQTLLNEGWSYREN